MYIVAIPAQTIGAFQYFFIINLTHAGKNMCDKDAAFDRAKVKFVNDREFFWQSLCLESLSVQIPEKKMQQNKTHMESLKNNYFNRFFDSLKVFFG